MIKELLSVLMVLVALTCSIVKPNEIPIKNERVEPQTLSRALKKAFTADREIQKLADKDFVLLNLVYETTDKHLSPDGQYVPRILFVDPSMTVRADIAGRYSNRMYTYEPSDMKLLLSNMQRAKKFLKAEL
ncbi:hypothetical protein P4O66_010035 [Electrophorus voltai]|uniref:Anterior gradient 1 n=1 Tax=Electrophorus voltai TaxID=2609070 RepID=A0AAD9DX73_9TELE|nr:hypothetical protein P4O66_010035 [Electrophorus voltai]